MDQLKRGAAVTFACVLAGTAQADQNSAFQDAKAFSGGKTQGVFTGVSSGAVADKIPGYGTNPSETQFFQGGQGALSGPGVTKMQNCASYAPGQNKIANQECEAVNFLARNPDVRPQFNIGNNDSMIIGAKNARDNAATVFQSLGISGGTGSSTQCTTRTVTTPAQYTTETCTSLRGIEGQKCTMGREVVIDAKTNYQCVDTQNSVNVYACKKTLNVSFPNAASIGFTSWPATAYVPYGTGGTGQYWHHLTYISLPAGAVGTLRATGYVGLADEKVVMVAIGNVIPNGSTNWGDHVIASQYVIGSGTPRSGNYSFDVSANITGGGLYNVAVFLWGAYNSDTLQSASVTFTGNVSVCPSGYTWSASRGGCYGAPVPTWSNECATFEAKAQ